MFFHLIALPVITAWQTKKKRPILVIPIYRITEFQLAPNATSVQKKGDQLSEVRKAILSDEEVTVRSDH